jgi:ATP-dependent RNA helicase DDX52/ROK1
METFSLLSRGGVKFNKKKFQNDIKLFNVSVLTLSTLYRTPGYRPYRQENGHRKSPTNKITDRSTLPLELDFFKYASKVAPERKTAQQSSRSDPELEAVSDQERRHARRASLTEEDREEGPSTLRHRVTTKGTDVPEPLESFEDLHTVFEAPTLLLQNLRGCGYDLPTPIQAHGASILLKV